MNAETLERIIPDELSEHEDTGKETLKLHLERYEFAAKHIQPGTLLDIACGVGYGSYYLAEHTGDKLSAITGVDISEDAIAYAHKRYTHPKIKFVLHDATKYTVPQKMDNIVSLETIEHIPNPDKFIAHLKTLLKPGGYLIGSVPTTPSVDANPHHVTDFTKSSFRKMFTDLGFEEVDAFIQIQPFSGVKIITRQEKRAQKMRPNMMGYYLSHPGAFFKRIFATLTTGFTNHYITIVWKLKA